MPSILSFVAKSTLQRENSIRIVFCLFLIEWFRTTWMKPPFTLEFHASGALLTTQDQFYIVGFKKIRHEKNLKSKILWHYPYKAYKKVESSWKITKYDIVRLEFVRGYHCQAILIWPEGLFNLISYEDLEWQEREKHKKQMKTRWKLPSNKNLIKKFHGCTTRRRKNGIKLLDVLVRSTNKTGFYYVGYYALGLPHSVNAPSTVPLFTLIFSWFRVTPGAVTKEVLDKGLS
jgi:hypothetical protein